MKARKRIYLVLIAALWAAAAPPARAGLRTTGNATIYGPIPGYQFDPHVNKWAKASLCVDIRADDDLCNLNSGLSSESAPCRTFTYESGDPQNDAEQIAALADSVEDFWDTLEIAVTPPNNPSILMGTYLSGARVQWQWDDYPIEAINKADVAAHTTNPPTCTPANVTPDCWFVTGATHYEYVNIEDDEARTAFAAEIINEHDGDPSDCASRKHALICSPAAASLA